MAKALAWAVGDGTRIGLAFGLLSLIAVAFGATGCNTIQGMGEDVSAAGNAVSDTAGDAKDEM
jgi:predicted small secreted protein